MARGKKTATTKRGSPEAIAKRRAARALNKLFDEGGTSGTLDGRTLKRKKRLMDELKKGRKGKALKAHEVLTHASELFALGETLTSLRRLKPLLPPTPTLDPETVEVIKQTQASYGFDTRAWKLIGVDVEAVIGGGSEAPPKKKAAKKKTSRRSKK